MLKRQLNHIIILNRFCKNYGSPFLKVALQERLAAIDGPILLKGIWRMDIMHDITHIINCSIEHSIVNIKT